MDQAERLSSDLEAAGMGCVVTTHAPYVLNPHNAHEPTLIAVDPGERAQRLKFLQNAVNIAGVLKAEAITFHAGAPPRGHDPVDSWTWLRMACAKLARSAHDKGLKAALEPKPGMLIETIDDYLELKDPVEDDAGAPLYLGLNLGHVLVTAERDADEAVHAARPRLASLALTDMPVGQLKPLTLGDGDLPLPRILRALEAIGYDKLISVEMPQSSEDAPAMIEHTLHKLRQNLSAA
jgi:sugar phosphate isomerase/epimerase